MKRIENNKIMLIYNSILDEDLSLSIKDVPADWIITADRRYFQQADAVVFYLPSLELENDLEKQEGQIWIAWCLEPKKNHLWMSESSSFVSVPAVSEKTLYIVSDDRYLYAINRSDGAVNWKYLLKGNTGESSPVVCRDKVIVCTRSGIITILDAKNGELSWEYDTGEQITASPAVTKGRFYILTTRGTLFCFGE